MRAALLGSAMLGAVALALPASAGAHISLHPNVIPAGAFATLEVRVPGEQEGAHVTEVDMLLPPGFTGVDYEPVPGWSVKVLEARLSTPLHQDGETIDTEVEQIVWSWTGPLGRIDNGQFLDFPLSVAIPSHDAGQALEFRTVQHYSNGQVVHWIEPSLVSEHPSPRIDVSAAGGLVEEVAGAEAGPAAGAVPAGAKSALAKAGGSSSSSEGLSIAALALGALGLAVGSAAMAQVRRGRPRA